MSTLGRVQVRSDLPPVTLGRTTVPPAPVTLGRTTAPVTLGRTTAPVTLGRTTAPVPLGRTTAPVTLGRISVPQSESMFSQRPETTLGLKPATTPVRVVEFPSLQKLGRVDVQQPEPMPVSKPDLPIPAPEIKRDTSPEKLQRIALPQNREPDVVVEPIISGNENSSSVTDLSNKPAGSYEGSMSSIFCEDNTSPANTEEKREAISLKLRERSEASETLADSVLIIEKSIQKWVTERKESFEEEACAAFIKKYEAVKEEWGSFVRDTVEIMKHIDTKFKAVRYCDVKMSIEEALVNILASYILIGKDAIAGDGIDNTLHVTKRKYFGTSTPRTDYYYLHQLHPTQDDVLKSDGLPEDLINAIMKDSYPSVSMRAEEFLRTLDSKLTNLHCLKYQLKDQDEKHNSFLKLKEDFTARVLALNKTIRIQEADIENTVDKDVKQALIENQKDRLEQKRKLSQEIKTLNEKIEEVIRIKDGGTLKDDTTTPRDIGLHKKIDAAINAIFSPIHFECVMHADWPTTLEFSIFCSLFPEDADYKKFKETISRLG